MRGSHATLGKNHWDGNDLASTRVLLVEDDPEAREILSWLLTLQGAEVRAVASVEEALAAFGPFGPDILVSDINLTDATGFDLVGELRGRGESLPAIAITTELCDLTDVLARGFQACLRKPVGTVELTDLVERLTARRHDA
jgi:DNA-binding response OmpR family regulator